MKELKIKDFEKAKYSDYEAKIVVWGEDSEVGVSCDGSTLEEMLPKINAFLAKLNSGREQIIKALIDDDMLSLAEDWASSAEQDEDSEQECYIMEDGTRVYLPITEEDFAKSIVFDGLSIYYDDASDDIDASVYVSCQPDYFACHCIEINVDGKFNIDVNGLAG